MTTFYFLTPFLSMEEERIASNSRKTLFQGYERLDVKQLNIDESWQFFTTGEELVDEMMMRVSKKFKRPLETAHVFSNRDISTLAKEVHTSVTTYLWENPTKSLQELPSNYMCQKAMQKWLADHQLAGPKLIGITSEALTLLLNSYDVTYHYLSSLPFLSGALIELKMDKEISIKLKTVE